jgi:hypothetical protein
MDSAARLDAIAAAHGVPLVTVTAEDELLRHIRAQEVDDLEQVTLRPMRSPFWLVPFVACLGGEWWLRRRSGVS